MPPTTPFCVRFRHPSREGRLARHPRKCPENTELRAILAILPSLAHRMKKNIACFGGRLDVTMPAPSSLTRRVVYDELSGVAEIQVGLRLKSDGFNRNRPGGAH